MVLKKKLEQRIESENLLRSKHEELHADMKAMTQLAERRKTDAEIAEAELKTKIAKLDAKLNNFQSMLQKTKSSNEVSMKSVNEDKIRLKADL